MNSFETLAAITRRLGRRVTSSNPTRKVIRKMADGTIAAFEEGHSLAEPHLDISAINCPRILHVDDDADYVDAITFRLKSLGYRVQAAHDGMAGVESALLYRSDAIVLDYDMPNMRGDEVIKKLRSLDATKNVPIVVLTAINRTSLRQELMGLGASAFINKPCDFSLLKETIEKLLN